MITLINCKLKLEALGIYMERIGSGALFEQELVKKIPNYVSWEYDFAQDQIKIWVEDGTEIPDLSEFGEVLSYEPTSW
jgi:hypothetical protein